MKESDPQPPRRSNKTRKPNKVINFRWAIIITGWSFCLSVLFTFISDSALASVGIVAAFFILAAFILLGIIFDILGVSVTAASEKPFHAMSSRKVNGAREALWLVRNAEKVSNFCNDVVGDIAGIISGSTAAIIISRVNSESVVFPFIVTGLVAGLTVGGKAIGKGIAISMSSQIVFIAARIIRIFKRSK